MPKGMRGDRFFLIAVPLSFVTRCWPVDGSRPEGIHIPRAPGRTFCLPSQCRLQPVAAPLCPKGKAYSSRSTRYSIGIYFIKGFHQCQVCDIWLLDTTFEVIKMDD